MSELTEGAPYVLVVDDDPAIQQMITSYFEKNNMPTKSANGRQGVGRSLATADPRAVILDMPRQTVGLNLLREIRSRSDVPVIAMADHRLDEIDRVIGLELGADDFIAKPFNMRELFARVRAILRRQEIGRVSRNRDRRRGGYRFSGWQLDHQSGRLIGRNGDPVSLTKGEYALLLAFLEAPGRSLSREHLLHATRVHDDIFDRSIDVQVLRLRRKLESADEPRLIRTERGVGYTFAATVEPF